MFALVALAACAGGVALAGRASARSAPHGTTAVVAFHSAALAGPLRFSVTLPAGYATSGLRYPVVYFLHGLPAGPSSFESVPWVAQALGRTGKQAILVIPQGSRTPNGDPEYHDWGPGDDWETALARDLPAYVDAHYRTVANRRGRAIVGVSAGGYGATILGVHHLARFGAIESWSGYFRPTTPDGSQTLDLGDPGANARASVHALVPALRSDFRRHPTYLAFYVGRGDPNFVPGNLRLNAELTRAHIPHTFHLYPGAHTTGLWEAHATAWLAAALDHLQAPERA